MSISMYAASVPVFKQLLGSLSDVLTKAEAHAKVKSIDANTLLQARLFPDMLPLRLQVQIAVDYATGVTARLADRDAPKYESAERSFAELHALINGALAFIDGFKPQQIDGSEQRAIVLRPGTPKERKLDGQAYLLHYSMPQFVFHVTTAYDILRHNGVEIGKRDFMGTF
ncbi:MAG: DUF1993 domain-containing protein [Herbaspirillum sp.]